MTTNTNTLKAGDKLTKAAAAYDDAGRGFDTACNFAERAMWSKACTKAAAALHKAQVAFDWARDAEHNAATGQGTVYR